MESSRKHEPPMDRDVRVIGEFDSLLVKVQRGISNGVELLESWNHWEFTELTNVTVKCVYL